MKLTNLPPEFLSLEKPPLKLFYRGNLGLLNKTKVAVIGSRKISTYTKNCVLDLGAWLKKADVCVVSGGALGVDIYAAKAAMPNTIGIFANGLGSFYPKNNEQVIKQIYEKALAFSEHEANYKAKPYDFLHRNRLIIALSKAVVIAQADLQSGTMSSANLALKMKKPLFVIAQRLEESKGTNLLLAKKQAKLIYDFKEFALQFGKFDDKIQEYDNFLEFCKKGVTLNEALEAFGTKVYEYELEGKIEIDGIFIRVNL